MGKVKESGELQRTTRTAPAAAAARSRGVSAPTKRGGAAGRAQSRKAAAMGTSLVRGTSRGESAEARPSRTTSRPTKRAAAPTPKQATAKRSAPAKPSRPAKRSAATVTRSSARPVKRPAKTAPKGKPGARKGARPVVAPDVQIRIRDLDPQAKCGPGTSVVRLIRVDEIVNRVMSAHLVFHDKYGWYCEHGKSCPAVRHALRHAQQVARPQ